MNLDDFQKSWQSQDTAKKVSINADALLKEVRRKQQCFRRTIFWRDAREVVVAALLVPVFLWGGWKVHWTLFLCAFSCFVVGAFMVLDRHRQKKRTPDLHGSLRDCAATSLAEVNHQIWLLKNILWWYLLPLGAPMLLFFCWITWEAPSPTETRIFQTLVTLFWVGFVLVIGVSVYWLNQFAVRKTLEPRRQELEDLLRELETESHSSTVDQKHIANLRRRAFSMTAASQVKPAEFKVAFWQIAIFGVPGIVGIWFFGMLALTEGNIPRMFIPKHLVWVVPFFLGGLLYSWLLQKITERAVGISPLGVHLNKGQNLLLWEEIKEVRPSKFLNIQNLWLIRESGEKTIMHWTPLERQPDLKAAVENFAPANHPIREFLSLLRSKPSKKSIVIKTIMLLSTISGILGISLFLAPADAEDDPRAPGFDDVRASDPVSEMLEAIRAKHKFPALAAAVVVDGKIAATNSVGFRKHGGSEEVTADDKFHIGSITKSMTATVAAMLVEQGKISWTTTVGESFADLGDDLHSDYRDATLEQLLSHRGGAPGNAPGDLWRKAWNASGSPSEQRLEFVKGLLARKPEAKPGAQHIYSNQGYAIAGAMLEKAVGKTWEELMRTMLFEPLGMKSAGFGAPATVGEVDQPWGHTKGMFGMIKAVPPGPRADNPPAIGPAGTVHCSVADLAAYAAFHMAGEQGDSELLKAESFKKLHTSAGDDYGLGWIVLEREWAGGRALMHNGSNTMFYVVLWMAPEKNCAVIVATNAGIDSAFRGCDEAVGNLIKEFFPK